MLCKKNSVSIIFILLNLISVSVKAQYQAVLEISNENMDFTNMAITLDGKSIITINNSYKGNNYISLWDANTGEKLKAVQSKNSSLGSILISPDGKKTLIGSSAGNFAVMWDMQEWKELYKIKTASLSSHVNTWPVFSIVFSEDGSKVITKSYEGYRVWNVADGTENTELTNIIKTLSPFSIASWNADNHLLYSTNTNEKIIYQDLSKMINIKSIDGGNPYLSFNKKYMSFVRILDICVYDLELNQLLGCQTFSGIEFYETYDVSNEGFLLIGGNVERSGGAVVNTHDRILFNPRTQTNLRVYPINGAVENSDSDNDRKVKFFPDGRHCESASRFLTRRNRIIYFPVSPIPRKKGLTLISAIPASRNGQSIKSVRLSLS